MSKFCIKSFVRHKRKDENTMAELATENEKQQNRNKNCTMIEKQEIGS
jgi:hypothetical protein